MREREPCDRTPQRTQDAERRGSEVAHLLVWLIPLLALLVWSGAVGRLFPAFVCPMRRLTGWPCPNCGMTRALVSLAHGRWEHALALHPLSPLVAVASLLLWIWAMMRSVFPARSSFRRWSVALERWLMSRWILYGTLLLALAVWIIRLIGLIVSGEARVLFRQGGIGRLLAL